MVRACLWLVVCQLARDVLQGVAQQALRVKNPNQTFHSRHGLTAQQILPTAPFAAEVVPEALGEDTGFRQLRHGDLLLLFVEELAQLVHLRLELAHADAGVLPGGVTHTVAVGPVACGPELSNPHCQCAGGREGEVEDRGLACLREDNGRNTAIRRVHRITGL